MASNQAMTTNANDNEPLTFQPLAAFAVRLLGRDEKQNEEQGDDPDASNQDQKKRDQHRAYVEQRLRELAAFERRANGGRSVH
ncbi:hypothetical protein [Bradyrhizobium sp. SZCCHNR2032]|uniref:hypothetical protein n=1 Tax=Bradyrhizobium sp. SZCCHNR2032 TaxID=3057384 RepID=UPI00291605AB|nr:hypothetical protein [Bradyrhizobium sp. SZCCHNR2032]